MNMINKQTRGPLTSDAVELIAALNALGLKRPMDKCSWIRRTFDVNGKVGLKKLLGIAKREVDKKFKKPPTTRTA